MLRGRGATAPTGHANGLNAAINDDFKQDRVACRNSVTVRALGLSGGPPGARAGTLSAMVAGDPAAVERVRPMISP